MKEPVKPVNEPLHILHLEDSLADASILEAMLTMEHLVHKITVVKKCVDFEAALANPKLGLILSDFSMPGFDGLTALEIARKARPEVPFIFLSGTIGEEMAVEALREGATDYVLKDRLGRLPTAIRRALADVESRKLRKQNEEQLRRQAALLDLAQDAICLNSLKQSILYWNKSAERLYGWTATEALGKNAIELLFQEDLTAPQLALKSVIRDGKWEGEFHQVSKDGRKLIVESRWTLLRDDKGEPGSILVINTDITEKKQIEAQLLRTQRIETIGALAGGIAHDLNNSLTPVSMLLSLLGDEITNPDKKQLLGIAQNSLRHSVEMVKQILLFSRGVGGEQMRVDVERLVDDVAKMAKDTFPRSIQIQSKVRPELHAVNGNATQLHQVLLNLCINARDAMPESGELRIEASNIALDETNVREKEQAPGPYVLLTVSDTGHGMSAEVLEKIFEPFFTTKEMGKGTGLGLSTVMGIVKTHGGFVEVSSEINKGTLFRVFLPAAKAA